MKILHILRSNPDEMVRMFIKKVSEGKILTEMSLFDGDVFYDRMVKQIFENDQVISWW